ncbi:glycoside hydrolase family 2 protein [Chitinophaga sancti]|uniref:Glycoside hydrolase family 2 n=1 Tax=Chitinophaga sancti TaxID=1004 RepID=A0A1K1M1C9_9BACT|nr:glycoside hydrolase family 2 [Chitinophaga sancti]WQD64706.1 glycoside hydrolase family 2 [Chitinophaga sancti]WQG89672.1 glycoside hydrolase family 2 [Chitinophaga sancti]SFW16948.1 Glycosyl hydrolases family 2, TIM barrel domain [Chitinophaga sancti]
MKTKYYLLLLLFHGLFFQNIVAQTAKLPTQWTNAAMSATVPFPEYPRPQLVRKDWLCLNGKWDYIGGKNVASALNPAKPINFSNKTEQILVPYCPESVLSGIERNQEINMWYRRTFEIPVTWKGKQVIINFDAVDHDATVFVNGAKAGSHAGGYSSFHINITSLLKAGTNTIVVAAHDPNDGRTPSGKNGPRGDYTFTSGIWQSVWLEPVGEHYIRNIRLLPDLANNRLELFVDGDNAQVKAIAMEGSSVVSSITGGTGTKLYLPIKEPKLWSPDNPFLYDLRITLSDSKGHITDEISSYFGMRDIKPGKLNGVNRPLLNNKFVMQVGLLDQGYWPDGVLTAPTEAALKFDIEFTKKAGFNLIRKHMKTEPKRFYYWADKLGLLVWQDMPAIWYQHEDTANARSTYRKELVAIMDDLYNSPSIITWVPFNENWGAFDVKEMTDWVKQLDPSRLVNGNSGFNNNPGYQKAEGDPGNGDFVDTHIYVGPYGASEPDDKRAASLGEFGGVGLFVRGHMWPVENNAYAYEPTKDRLTDRYILLMDQVEQLMRYKGLSVAIYTQTTDVEHEVNGMLTYDREVEKMNMEMVKDVNEAIIKAGNELNK